MRRYDLVVVGGGTAGLVAAVGGAWLGARVCLVEREATGGECLWTGCVPSKTLIAAASLAHRMRNADVVGLEPAEPTVDLARVLERVRSVQRRIAAHESPERLAREGVDVLRGAARFVGPGLVSVDGRLVPYRVAVLATGSRPLVPAIDGLEEVGYLTSETVWGLDELPRRMVVIGGGTIGCELGQALGRLGSAVTVVESAAALLADEEPEARELVAGRLAGEGVDVLLDARALRSAAGRLVVETADGEASLPFDRLLVAAGRRPNTEALGLEAVGVETDEQGAVVVDARLRTTAPRVYAAGDVTGKMPFTHAADYQARIAVANALFRLPMRASYDAVPRVVFTDPEIAAVGLTEQQARERWGRRARVAAYPYEELDRALCAGETHGFVKLVGDPRGRLVGATVASPVAAGAIVAELAALVRRRGRIAEIARTVHAYPTFAEAPARAADEYLRARWLNARTRRLTRPLLAVLRRLDAPRVPPDREAGPTLT